MIVRVKIDPEYVYQDISRDAEVGVVICFEHEEMCYPGQEWNDFGFRILGFWLEQILRVREGHSTTPAFKFLDGEFCLFGALDMDGTVELVPQNADKEFRWRIDWAILENAIIDAAKSLCEQVTEIGLEPRGIEGINAGLRQLTQQAPEDKGQRPQPGRQKR